MNPRLSSRVLHMSESETLKMAQMARDLKAQGKDVISLSLGEPDFDTPASIKAAATEALDQSYTKYTPVAGLPELREAISRKLRQDNGLDYSPAQIVVSNGAKQSVANLCQALLDPGDEVILFSPYWVSYIEIVRLAEGVPVLVNAGIDQDYKVRAEDLRSALTSRTRFVLFSSPCNPTGSVYSRQELGEIAAVLADFPDVLVISDEIYEYIIFDREHVSIGSLPSMQERTVTINGFSKGYAMTGWRLGYIGAPRTIADACIKIQGQFTSGANSFAQKAAVFALENGRDEANRMRDAFQQRRDLVVDLLGQIPGLKVNRPEGAFYVFPDASAYIGRSVGDWSISSVDDLCDYIMQEAYVGLVAGSAFGAPDCFRISYAASEAQLKEAIRRISQVLSRLA